MLLHNVGPLIEIPYLELLNLNDGILQLYVEKFVGYLWAGLRNLFWNIFDLILRIKTKLFKNIKVKYMEDLADSKLLSGMPESIFTMNDSYGKFFEDYWFALMVLPQSYVCLINVSLYEGITLIGTACSGST